MAYATSSLKLLAGQTYDRRTARIWSYQTTDSLATIKAANYFADAKLRGMRAGDRVFAVVTSNGVPVAAENLLIGAVSGSGATMNAGTQELTASGAVSPGTSVLELNHASVVIAATMNAAEHKSQIFIVKDTSATGTAAHTLTLTNGTFNGTATVATLNARDEFLIVHFDSAGRGQVIANVGSVALS